MRRWIGLAAFVVAVVGMGVLIGTSTPPGDWYAELQKPPLNPPNWLFPPVWTVLYTLIAYVGWRTRERSGRRSPQFSLWAIQMGLNFVWSPIVFSVNELGLGLLVLVTLLFCLFVFILRAWKSDRVSAFLFLPYAAWVAFATYLNAGLYVLNQAQ